MCKINHKDATKFLVGFEWFVLGLNGFGWVWMGWVGVGWVWLGWVGVRKVVIYESVSRQGGKCRPLL